jgi:DNA polymerase II small subunit
LIKGIEDLLEYRHLYPEYGSFISLAPYSKDYLVIDDIPDIVVTGHLHKANHGIYKGIRIVNCGTFVRTGKENEDLSSLGVFPIIETGTGEIEMLDLKNVKY